MITSSPELVTTGEHLSGARSARGMSIEYVAHATRIPASHLRGLEAGDYEDFDGVAYSKSFLRLYGNYLGVDVTDGLALLEEHRELSGKPNHYPFLDVPDKIRFASEMKAPRSSTIPLVVVLLGMLLVVAVPIGFLLAKRHPRPENGMTTTAGGAVIEHPVVDSTEKNEGGSDAVPIDLSEIARVPVGQLERIRNPQKPEVRRAEVIEDETQPPDDETQPPDDGNDPGVTADADKEAGLTIPPAVQP